MNLHKRCPDTWTTDDDSVEVKWYPASRYWKITVGGVSTTFAKLPGTYKIS